MHFFLSRFPPFDRRLRNSAIFTANNRQFTEIERLAIRGKKPREKHIVSRAIIGLYICTRDATKEKYGRFDKSVFSHSLAYPPGLCKCASGARAMYMLLFSV